MQILKQVVLSLSIFVVTLFSFVNVIVAANYGEGTYGSGVYNNGDEGSSGTPGSDPSAPGCGLPAPGNPPPSLYSAASQSGTSILLKFTKGTEPISHYVLEYGTTSGVYSWSAENIGGSDTTSYLVKALSPGTTYYLRVRAGNDCASGPWSNELSARTKGGIAFNQINITETELTPVSTPPSQSPEIPQQEETIVEAEEGYSINIKVIDKEANPVVGAHVEIHSIVQTGTTDEQGTVRFTNVEPGQHRVLVAANGYEGEQSINLSGDVKEVNLNITIEQKSVSATPLVMGILGAMGVAIVVLIILLIRAKRK